MKTFAHDKIFWEDRPVLVTGAAGFIGSWLTHRLLELGARVSVLDIKDLVSSPHVPHRDLSKTDYVRGTVCDTALVEGILRKRKIKTIFHLAAEAIVGESYKNPLSSFETNVHGTASVLDTARKTDLGIEIVVASSDKAYGSQDNLPYREDAPLIGRNPYDCSKSCADLVCQSYAATYGSKIIITRCGNVFGGGDLNFSRLIPDIIRSHIEARMPVLRSNGNYRRDFVYIDDIVSAYIISAEALGEGKHYGEAFNFGHNDPRCVIDIAKEISRLMRMEEQFEIVANAQFEIYDQYLDTTKARTLLGWGPTTDLVSGLEKTISWYRSYLA